MYLFFAEGSRFLFEKKLALHVVRGDRYDHNTQRAYTRVRHERNKCIKGKIITMREVDADSDVGCSNKIL